VVNNHDTVARKVDVELDPVYAEGEGGIERGDRILRCERGAAAVSEYERA
jgi:hypothetical protein